MMTLIHFPSKNRKGLEGVDWCWGCLFRFLCGFGVETVWNP